MKTQFFEKDTTWLCPAGLKQVALYGYEHEYPLAIALDTGVGVDKNEVVWAWGYNANGQIGDASVVGKSVPTLVVGSILARQAITTASATHILERHGQLYGVGQNNAGQIGDGTVIAKSSPVLVVGDLRFKKIAAAWGNSSKQATYALSVDGDLYSWGGNPHGQLGDGTQIDKSSPVLVAGGKKWKDVAAGQDCAFGLDEDNALYAWGQNSDGNLGDGTVASKSSPVLVTSSLRIKQIGPHILLTTDGDAYCWGVNSSGSVGQNNTTAQYSTPTLVLGGLKFEKIGSGGVAGGGCTHFGITKAHVMYAWGANLAGQLGDNSTTPKSTPVVVAGNHKWFNVAMSYGSNSASAAITLQGDLYAWGNNTTGGLVDGTNNHKSSPGLATGGKKFFREKRIREKVILDVTPGQTYTVIVNKYIATFGGRPIGKMLKGVALEHG